jgi:hypothetical protein
MKATTDLTHGRNKDAGESATVHLFSKKALANYILSKWYNAAAAGLPRVLKRLRFIAWIVLLLPCAYNHLQ